MKGELQISSYLSDPKDAVTIGVQFSKLPDGTNHVATSNIDGVSKQLTVAVQNSNYQKMWILRLPALPIVAATGMGRRKRIQHDGLGTTLVAGLRPLDIRRMRSKWGGPFATGLRN
jgi:hypothetical protein